MIVHTAEQQAVIRPMSLSDIPAADRLRKQAQFNQTHDDWHRLLGWAPHGCFVAELDGRLVGTVTTTPYGRELAWIGMMLVDTAYRRRGLGRQLITHALQATAEATCVALDATPLGKTLYDQLGFIVEARLSRWQGSVAPPRIPRPSRGVAIRTAQSADRGAIAQLDESATGVKRGLILDALTTVSADACLTARRNGRLVGFALARPGADHHVIGPVIADDAAAATALIDAHSRRLAGQDMVIDVPDPTPLAEFLTERGLAPSRPLIRMSRGEPLPAGKSDHCYAIISPEVG